MAVDEPATTSVVNSTIDQIDPSNPYFLHHSDNPGMKLVSQDLTGDNFSTWDLAMTTALSAKNKLCFVDGSKPMPSAAAADFQVWRRCNDMVKSWLINSISTDIANSVLYVSLAEDIWKQLRERFAQSNGPRLYQLRRDIALCSQDTMSIAAYYTKLKSLWDELSSLIAYPTCSCDSSKAFKTYQQQASLTDFLMGLNESFSGIRGQILLMDPLPTVNKAYALLLQDEKQRSIVVNSPNIADSTAFAVSSNPQNWRLNSAKANGHRRPLHCDHCGRSNHVKEKCYALHGYPPGHRLHKSGSPSSTKKFSSTDLKLSPEQYQVLMNLLDERSNQPLSNMAGLIAEDDDWNG